MSPHQSHFATLRFRLTWCCSPTRKCHEVYRVLSILVFDSLRSKCAKRKTAHNQSLQLRSVDATYQAVRIRVTLDANRLATRSENRNCQSRRKWQTDSVVDDERTSSRLHVKQWCQRPAVSLVKKANRAIHKELCCNNG